MCWSLLIPPGYMQWRNPSADLMHRYELGARAIIERQSRMIGAKDAMKAAILIKILEKKTPACAATSPATSRRPSKGPRDRTRAYEHFRKLRHLRRSKRNKQIPS